MKITPSYIKQAQTRLIILNLFLVGFLSLLGLRVADLTIFKYKPTAFSEEQETQELNTFTKRGDIVDRNGVTLATSLVTSSLFADPSEILDVKEAAHKISCLLPDLSEKEIEAKISVPSKRFVWLYRHLTPRQHQALHELGLPGIHFEKTEKRVYLHKKLFSHTVGYTDVDNRGIAGIEHSFESTLKEGEKPVQLSLDIRLQHILSEEIQAQIDKFKAIGGMGTLMDIHTGEILAMVSLPDFDPNNPCGVKPEQRFNGNTSGVYELGSGLKLLTAAMALDSGKATFSSTYDASQPIKVGRRLIRDYKGKNRPLTLPEVIIYSSNIGAAKMALDVGTSKQQDFLFRLGLLTPTKIELPEVSRPLYPARHNWKEVNTMTIAFGHGLAVSPVQMLTAMGAVVNGGYLVPSTLIKRGEKEDISYEQVISTRSSNLVCRLMRSVVLEGTGRKAAVPGYMVMGKSGTAEKVKGGRYSKNANMSSFLGAFPSHKPSHILFVMLDEPKGIKESYGYSTGGWVAAPLAGNIIKRAAPLLAVEPVDEDAPEILRSTSLNKCDINMYSPQEDFHLAAQSAH